LQPERGTMIGKITANYDLLKLTKIDFGKLLLRLCVIYF
jgi:hypothetical protein